MKYDSYLHQYSCYYMNFFACFDSYQLDLPVGAVVVLLIFCRRILSRVHKDLFIQMKLSTCTRYNLTVFHVRYRHCSCLQCYFGSIPASNLYLRCARSNKYSAGVCIVKNQNYFNERILATNIKTACNGQKAVSCDCLHI